MLEASSRPLRRTSADDVFDRLHADIVTLKRLPGAKLSEVEIARQFDVSRQPVREAFIRLADLDLLQVQPQRATEVRRFSETAINNSRFIRMAIEVEAIRIACTRQTAAFEKRFEANLRQQKKALEAGQTTRFNELDNAFHRLICEAADCEFAFESVAATKSQISRLCLLSLSDEDELRLVYDDHQRLFDCIRRNSEEEAVSLMRQHLSRIEKVIGSVRERHAAYFDSH